MSSPSASQSRVTGFSTFTLAAGLLVIIAVLVTIGLLTFYRVRSEDLEREAITGQQNRADEIAAGIETYLISARQLANTTAELNAPLRDDADQVEGLLHRIFESAPTETIYGIGVWFEPYAFSDEIEFFGPYIHQGIDAEAEPVLTYEWTTPEYNFPTQGWYLAGKQGNGNPVFTEPYFDTNLVYMSGSRAFFNEDGDFIGVVTVDMVLPLLRDYLAEVNVREEETIYVTTASGAVFVHPQERAILRYAAEHDLFSTPLTDEQIAAGQYPTILELDQADLAAYKAAQENEDRYSVAATVDYVDWTVHIDTDESFLFSAVHDLRNTMLLVGLIMWGGVAISLPILSRLAIQTRKASAEKATLEARLSEQKASQELLQQMNDELERRVQARTAELEAAKEEAEEANRVKSRFLANMSHELRTPLNAILNFTEFMSDGFFGPVTQEQIDILDKVSGSGDHLLSLINDILDITKIEVGKMELFMEEVDFAAVLKSVTSTGKGLIKEKPVEMVIKLDDDLPIIRGDRRRLHQVFLNLLSNAVKFTAAGTITFTAKREGDQLHFTVKDTGVGIPPDEQELVFESFRQAQNSVKQSSGTGLGLPISKHFVEAHGGKMWMESKVGQGSVFHVTLPIVTEKPVNTDDTPTPVPA